MKEKIKKMHFEAKTVGYILAFTPPVFLFLFAIINNIIYIEAIKTEIGKRLELFAILFYIIGMFNLGFILKMAKKEMKENYEQGDLLNFQIKMKKNKLLMLIPSLFFLITIFVSIIIPSVVHLCSAGSCPF